MRFSDILRLLLLAALWGGSFIFLRVLAPNLGPVFTASLRLLIAGSVLVVYFHFVGFDVSWRHHWKQYSIIGAVNSAIPFTLFSYGAIHMPASYEVILNSSSPLFGAVFSALWLAETLTPVKVAGLLLGSGGVVLVARAGGAQSLDPRFPAAVVACLVGAACYGLGGVYVKRKAKGTKPAALAGATQLLAGLFLLPLLPFSPMQTSLTPFLALNLMGLALLCSVLAYLLYFRLIADVGPSKALTVTFLMPVFGMLWGALFLGETITFRMIQGCGLIIAGTALVLFARKR